MAAAPGLVQIIHQSAREFLIRRPRTIGGVEMRSAQSISNAYITDVCISFLKFPKSEARSKNTYQEIDPFLSYAGHYWLEHLRDEISLITIWEATLDSPKLTLIYCLIIVSNLRRLWRRACGSMQIFLPRTPLRHLNEKKYQKNSNCAVSLFPVSPVRPIKTFSS